MSCPDAAGRGGSASRSEAPRPRRTLPKAAKLRVRRQFLETYDAGRRASGRALALFGRPSPSGQTRLGITVTRKFGGAVARNRIKRRLREIFRLHRGTLTPALDVVVNVREEAATLPRAELEREFLDCFQRLARRFGP